MDEENQSEYKRGKQVYSILEGIPYGNIEGVSLLDIVELSDTTRNERGLVLSTETVAPIAKCMTAAQIGMLEFVGLDTLLVMADAVRDETSTEAYRETCISRLADTEMQYAGKTVSVYTGVDRSLYTDPESIALTGEAVKNRAINAGTQFGRKNETEEKTGLYIGLVVLAGVFIFGGFCAFASLLFFNFSSKMSMLIFGGSIVCVALGMLILFLFVDNLIITEITYEDVTYTPIPRVLVDIKITTNQLNKREEKHYVPYYAAYNIEAKAGETDTTKLFGDLNGLSGKAQWLVLYYTKDTLAGKPLKAGELLVKERAGFSQTELTGYLPIHILGLESAENLNQYHVNDAPSIYAAVPIAPDTEADDNEDETESGEKEQNDNDQKRKSTPTGSVFTDSSLGTLLAGIGFFAAGGLSSMLVTRGYYRKKKSER